MLSNKSINMLLSLVEQERAENEERITVFTDKGDSETANALTGYAANLDELDTELRMLVAGPTHETAGEQDSV